MAMVECSRAFFLTHRTPDFPVFDAGLDEFRRLAEDGLVAGDACRVQMGDRQGSDAVWVTVWLSVPVDAPSCWKIETDAGEPTLRHRFTRGFHPAKVSPRDIIAATRELLLAQPTVAQS